MTDSKPSERARTREGWRLAAAEATGSFTLRSPVCDWFTGKLVELEARAEQAEAKAALWDIHCEMVAQSGIADSIHHTLDLAARAEQAEAERDKAQGERDDAFSLLVECGWVPERGWDHAVEVVHALKAERDAAVRSCEGLIEGHVELERERDAARARCEALQAEVDKLRPFFDGRTPTNADQRLASIRAFVNKELPVKQADPHPCPARRRAGGGEVNVYCDWCRRQMHQQGALFFGPPNAECLVFKRHLCVDCYEKVLKAIAALTGAS